MDYAECSESIPLLQQLIAAGGVNPPGCEREVAGVLADDLDVAGIDCRRLEPAPGYITKTSP